MEQVPWPQLGVDAHPSHVDLLHHADAIQEAALRRDEADLHQGLCRFRTAVVDHLHQESTVHASLPPATRAVIGEGQRRLVRLVDEMLLTGGDTQETCRCISRAAELHHALVVQARIETRCLLAAPKDDPARGPEAS